MALTVARDNAMAKRSAYKMTSVDLDAGSVQDHVDMLCKQWTIYTTLVADDRPLVSLFAFFKLLLALFIQ